MLFNWNIPNWINNMLPLERRTDINKSYIKALLSGTQTIQTDFEAGVQDWDFKVKYNSQQKVLTALLNRLFDPTLKRIRIETIADVYPDIILYFDPESVEGPVLYFDTESAAGPIISHDDEESEYDYRILVPAALSADEDMIYAWVARYNTSARKFQIIYI